MSATAPRPDVRDTGGPVWLAAVLTIIPPLWILWVVWNYSLNIPIDDHWPFARTVLTLFRGELGWSDVWKASGQHRIVAPKLLMLALASVTRWDVRAEIWVNVGIALTTLGLAIDLARRTLRPIAPRSWFWTAPALSAILFSLAAWQAWTFGWMLNLYLTTFGAVLAAWAVGRFGTTPTGATLALTGTTIAAYSYLSAILLYPLLPVVLWLAGEPGRDRNRIAALTAAGAAMLLGAYFIDYPTGSASGAISSGRLGGLDYLHFLLAFLGNPLGLRTVWMGEAWGLASLLCVGAVALTALLRFPGDLRRLAPWLLLGGYAVGGAGATALGRSGGGIVMAMLSRYAMPASLLLLAVPACVVVATRWSSRQSRAQRLIATALLAVVVMAGSASWGLNQVRGLHLTADRHAALLRAEHCLRHPADAPRECFRVLSDTNIPLIRWLTPRLRQARLSLFAASESDPG